MDAALSYNCQSEWGRVSLGPARSGTMCSCPAITEVPGRGDDRWLDKGNLLLATGLAERCLGVASLVKDKKLMILSMSASVGGWASAMQNKKFKQ